MFDSDDFGTDECDSCKKTKITINISNNYDRTCQLCHDCITNYFSQYKEKLKQDYIKKEQRLKELENNIGEICERCYIITQELSEINGQYVCKKC
jgi:cell division protein FtsX